MSQKEKSKQMILRRVYLLFFIVVFLFSLLVIRLADMQLLNRNFYQQKLTNATTYMIKTSTPRGQIYDAKGTALVTNQVKEVVTFTRSNLMTAEDIKEKAQALLSYVTLSDVNVSDQAKKDYYLADPQVYKEVVDDLPREKKYDKYGNALTEATIYKNAIKSVDSSKLTYSQDELKAISLFTQMNAASVFNTVSLVTDPLSEEQLAYLAANKSKLEGISIKTDWQRQAVASSLSSIIGTVSTEKTGLPEEEAEAYLKKGYSLNDRVGTSYLEKAYEDVLQGSRQVQKIVLDKKGKIIKNEMVEAGKKGNNIKLTIDLNFQQGVEEILKNYFQSELTLGHTQNSEGIYAVVLNPNTGAILSMAGIAHDPKTNEIKTDALGTMTQVFTPGSVVKGATLSAGWENEVIEGNQVLYDQPIDGIESWFTNGGVLPITAKQALEYSSNTYMVQIALRLMGQTAATSAGVGDNYVKAMENLRKTYAQYGLGIKTGIDLPGESSGFIPKSYTLANTLTEAFGQFDNYTTLQLAQYVATVANGGQRLAPHLVEGIYDNNEQGGLGNLVKTIETKALNQVSISSEDMTLLQEGFYNVVHGGSSYTTGAEIGYGESVSISAKTGTAEAYVTSPSGDSVYTSNLNVVAYAPSTNPQVAVAVVLPHSTDLLGTTSHKVTRDIINLYVSSYGVN